MKIVLSELSKITNAPVILLHSANALHLSLHNPKLGRTLSYLQDFLSSSYRRPVKRQHRRQDHAACQQRGPHRDQAADQTNDQPAGDLPDGVHLAAHREHRGGGPTARVAIAGIFVLLPILVSGFALLLALFKYLTYFNLVLGAFNLIPGFPLDGGGIVMAIV